MKQGGQEYDFLSGKTGRWTHLFVPSAYSKYKLDLNLDTESLGKALDLKKRGIKNTISNKDGEYWITLSSPVSIDTKAGPRTIEPPAVINTDGSQWDPKVGIGEGSDVTCKVWIRKYKNPNNKKDEIALRLYGVKVDNLIPFDPRTDFEDSKKRIQIEGLKEHQTAKPW